MSSKLVLPDFPFEIEKLGPEDSSKLFEQTYKCFQKYFVHVGPSRYFFNDRYLALAANVYNFEIRTDDIFVATFPKAGTTWTQELVWMVANNFDYKTALTIPLVKRFPFLEYSMYLDNDRAREIIKETCGDTEETKQIAKELTIPATVTAADMPSPRYLKTHSPFSLLPPNILDKAKVIYVARDARDVAVSYHHHYAIMPTTGYIGDFKSFWNFFKKGLPYAPVSSACAQELEKFWEYVTNTLDLAEGNERVIMCGDFNEWVKTKRDSYEAVLGQYGDKRVNEAVDFAPYFDHLKEAWALKDHPNMLFLFYEELSKDLPAVIRRVAKFLDKPVTEGQIAGLCEHLSFENFKKNNSVNYDILRQIGIIEKDKNFVRKGKTGDWRSHFDEEMAKDAEQWIADNLRGTDIKFPQ